MPRTAQIEKRQETDAAPLEQIMDETSIVALTKLFQVLDRWDREVKRNVETM